MRNPKPIEWRTELVRAGDITAWPENPRGMTGREAEDLTKSLKKFGYADIVVLNADKSMIGGHMRTVIMYHIKMIHEDDMIECRLPNRQLSEREHAELALRLNKNSGHWDFDKLANEFDTEDLLDWGFLPSELSISVTGNSVADALDGETPGGSAGESTSHLTKCPACGYEFDKSL